MKYVVASVEEIPPGQRKIVEVAGRSIGIFNLGGEFFALRNRCPHQGGPLCVGKVWGLITGDLPGQFQYSRRGEIDQLHRPFIIALLKGSLRLFEIGFRIRFQVFRPLRR